MNADYTALANFRFYIRRFLRVSEDVVRHANVEPQQYQLMLCIKAFEAQGSAVSVTMLAERLLLRHHSVVGLLDRLEAKALVERRRDVIDQRRVLVTLTPAGEASIAELALAHQEELTVLGPMLINALEAVVRSAPSRTGAAEAAH